MRDPGLHALRVPTAHRDTHLTRFFADTWLLLTLQWRLAWNAFWTRSLARKLVPAILAVIVSLSVISFTAGIGYAAGRLLRRYPSLGLEPLLPGLLLTLPALLLLVVAFGMALGSLFLAGDLELLMAAPVDRRAVLASRLLDGMSWYYALLAVTALPALITYGLALHYGPAYYLLGAICVLAMPLFPAGLASLLVMIVARFAPVRRVHEFMGLAVALFGLGASVAGQTARLWLRGVLGAGGDLRALLAGAHAMAALPIPTFVAGRGLAAAGAGDPLGAAAGVAGCLALTFGTFALCLAGADTLYATGWVRMQSGGTARRRRGPSAGWTAAAPDSGGWLARAPAALAVCLKDWRVLPRDLRNVAQLLTPILILPFVYANLVGRNGRRGGEVFTAADRFARVAPGLRGAAVAAGVLILTVLIFGRLARTSVSREGRSWWILKTAPISGREVLGGKLIAAAVPFAILSTLLLAVAAIWNGYGPAGTLYGWYGMQVLGAGMLALNVAFSVPWARLDWDDPRRMTSTWATVASLASSAVLGVAGGFLLILPLLAEAFAPSLIAAAWAVGPAAALALSAGTGALAIQFGVRRLPLVGEA